MSESLPVAWLVRHGETEWSLAGRHTGLTDLPLTARGEDTARSLAGRLQGIVPASVYTSPLQRAARTCALAGFGAAAVGLLLAWAYSAPPARLKRNGWWGNAACAACYEGLAWVTGAAVMAGGAMPGTQTLLLAALYSAGAHGIMTLNDFKAIEGDRQMGIRSLPVQLGVAKSARIACIIMAVPQVVVVFLLIAWQRPVHAIAVGFMVFAQLALMDHFLDRPRERATWYSGLGVTLYVIGMMVSAFALRGLAGGQ